MKKYKINFKPEEVITTSQGKETFFKYISEAGTAKGNKRMILVECKCKKQLTVQLTNIRNGNSFCCGHYPCRTSKLKGNRDKEVGYKALLYVYKKGAKKRGFEFSLPYEQFKKLLTQNCHYCNVKPFAVYQLLDPKTGLCRSGIPIKYNGIDRVDPLKGYILSNVVTCCKNCNVAKSNMTLSEFLKWVKALHKNIDKWHTP